MTEETQCGPQLKLLCFGVRDTFYLPVYEPAALYSCIVVRMMDLYDYYGSKRADNYRTCETCKLN